MKRGTCLSWMFYLYFLLSGGRRPRSGRRSVSRPIASSCSCSSPPSRSLSANQRSRIHCAPTTPPCTPCRTSNPGPRRGSSNQLPNRQTRRAALSVVMIAGRMDPLIRPVTLGLILSQVEQHKLKHGSDLSGCCESGPDLMVSLETELVSWSLDWNLRVCAKELWDFSHPNSSRNRDWPYKCIAALCSSSNLLLVLTLFIRGRGRREITLQTEMRQILLLVRHLN